MRVSTEPPVQQDAAAAAPRITVSGASKSYGALQVFRDVNLKVGHREILALVGPSGCGKTTLLRCLDGLIPMSAGEVQVDGQRVTGPLPKAAMVFEPDVLLMDEPFAAVDAQTREILQFELLRIWQMRPTSTIFVTHSIEEAVLMGDRVVVLKGKPSTVSEIVQVNLPRPRTRETLASPRFAELREHVWRTLMDEARRAEFQLER